MLPNDDPSKDILTKSKPLGLYYYSSLKIDSMIFIRRTTSIQECLTICKKLSPNLKYAAVQDGFDFHFNNKRYP